MALEKLKSVYAPGAQVRYDGTTSNLQSTPGGKAGSDITPDMAGPGLNNNKPEHSLLTNPIKFSGQQTKLTSLADVYPSQAGLNNLSSNINIVKKAPFANAKGAGVISIGEDASPRTAAGGSGGNKAANPASGETHGQEGTIN